MGQINKITIIGGGSSGWMTAATFIKYFPEKEIELIESPDIPIIGVGESTTGMFNNWLYGLGIKEEDFLKETDSVYKLSIKFTDFKDKDSGGYHYPLGSPYLENSAWGLWDWHLVKHKYPEVKNEDFIKYYFPVSALFEENKVSENKDGQFDNFRHSIDIAYHIDAIKLGKWLREKYAIPRGVKHTVATVKEINTDEDGIKNIVLDNGDIITSDLFIDCTGFKSMLLGGALQEPFESLEDKLFNNGAWVTPIQYKDKEKELRPYTECIALGSGWAWYTPIWSRAGTGYVFSDKFISKEDALEEFKEFLMSDKMPIPMSKEEVENQNFRYVPMKTGIYSRLWVKNVIGIGLAGGFIEPLEGNGLYSVHEFLVRLLRVLELPKISQFDKDLFNSTTRSLFKNFSEFVGLHYALSHRDDTPYWKAVTSTTYSQEMVEVLPFRSHGYNNFQDIYMQSLEYNNIIAGVNYVSTGMGYLLVDDYIMQMKELYNPEQDYDTIAMTLKEVYEQKMNKWKNAAEKELTMYEYLNKKYYLDN